MISRFFSVIRPATFLGLVCAAIACAGFGQPVMAGVISYDVDRTLNATNVESFDLDIDRNGTTDFTFVAAYVPDPFLSVGFDQVEVPFASSNGTVIDTQMNDGFPPSSLLAPRDTVSDANLFSFGSNDKSDLFFFTSFDPPTGNFGGQTGFIGLKFEGAGGILFGFAQITINGLDDPANPLGLTIGTVGYESVAGQAVQIIPEPSSVLLVGLGVVGMIGLGRRHLRRPNPSGQTQSD